MSLEIRRTSLHLALLFVVSLASVARGQSADATLQGTVTDPTGAVVPASQINILSQTTGVSRDARSNSSGFFAAPNLTPGRYKVTIAAAGFTTKIDTDVILSVGEVRELKIPLTI